MLTKKESATMMTTPATVIPVNTPAKLLPNQLPLGTKFSFFDSVGTTQSGISWAVVKWKKVNKAN